MSSRDADPTEQGSSLTLLSCPSTGTTARCSSVLQRNSKLYGPMNAIAASQGSSCWNSDASEDQKQFLIDFGRVVEVHQLKLQFQAGFSSEVCDVHIQADGRPWEGVDECEPKDTHEVQSFSLERDGGLAKGDLLKIIFDEFKDFYGRVTVYRIEVWGKELAD